MCTWDNALTFTPKLTHFPSRKLAPTSVAEEDKTLLTPPLLQFHGSDPLSSCDTLSEGQISSRNSVSTKRFILNFLGKLANEQDQIKRVGFTHVCYQASSTAPLSSTITAGGTAVTTAVIGTVLL